MKRFAWAMAVAALATLVCQTDSWSQTTSGAQSLNITPGGRADAMGRASVAMPQDATANWWNPAALAWRSDRVVSLMHARLVPDLANDVYYEFLGYSMHLAGWGGIGASIVYLGYGESVATDSEGNDLGTFSSYEVSPQLSIGTEIYPGVAAGLTLKYVYVDLAPAWATSNDEAGTGDTFGADLAMLWRVKEIPGTGMPINIGLNVQNLGPDIAYVDQDQSDPIGRNLKIGFASRVYGGNGSPFVAILAYDFNQSLVPDNNETSIHNVGGEIGYDNTFAVRAGYIRDPDGDIEAPTFGAGFKIGRFATDYASVPQASLLDRVNKFSISYNF